MAVRQPKCSNKSRPTPYPTKSTSDPEHLTEPPPVLEGCVLENIVSQVQDESKEEAEGSAGYQSYPCVSARQPYAGFILNGYKTLETRWTPMFKDLEHQTVAIHIAHRTWEGCEWKDALHLRGMSDTQIECLVAEAEACDRGMIAGLVDIGETWQCMTDSSSANQRAQWEKDALLKPLEEKYLTELTNPRWLKKPIRSRGQKGVWTVRLQMEESDLT